MGFIVAEIRCSDEGPEITILIGPNRSEYQVPITRLKGNMYFIEDLRESDEFGSVISGARWIALNERRFFPVYEWLRDTEYAPRLKDNTLEGIVKDTQYASELERSGRIFDLARQLLLWDLVNLVAQKFAVLCSRFCKLKDKPVLEIITVIRLVYNEPSSETEGENHMRNLLVQLVAEFFWDLVTEQPSNLKHGLARFPEFHVAVLDRMVRLVKERHGLIMSDGDEDSRAAVAEG
jgi:hypothetical protein